MSARAALPIDPRLLLARQVTERDWTAQVRQVARLCGWEAYHAWNSQHSPSGFPDVLAIRPPRLVVAELKTGRGRLTDRQERWLWLFRKVAGVEAYVWRPSDIEAVLAVLR